jgi:hypothetical protein
MTRPKARDVSFLPEVPFLGSTATAIPSSRPEICRAPRAAAVKDGLLSAWRRMATAAEAAVNFARRRGAATTAKWQADYDSWQKRDLLLDAVVLSLVANQLERLRSDRGPDAARG